MGYLELVCKSVDELPVVARQILACVPDLRIWNLEGNLGAGKTTFLQVVGRLLGIEEAIQSPTFSLMNLYHLPDGSHVYHFDFYRLQQPEEALDIGCEEFFYSTSICWIEWGSRIAPYLPLPRLDIHILAQGVDQTRIFQLKRYE